MTTTDPVRPPEIHKNLILLAIGGAAMIAFLLWMSRPGTPTAPAGVKPEVQGAPVTQQATALPVTPASAPVDAAPGSRAAVPARAPAEERNVLEAPATPREQLVPSRLLEDEKRRGAERERRLRAELQRAQTELAGMRAELDAVRNEQGEERRKHAPPPPSSNRKLLEKLAPVFQPVR